MRPRTGFRYLLPRAIRPFLDQHGGERASFNFVIYVKATQGCFCLEGRHGDAKLTNADWVVFLRERDKLFFPPPSSLSPEPLIFDAAEL